MATHRPQSTATTLTDRPAAPAAAPRHRLRAVDRDEEWHLPSPAVPETVAATVADLLPPGATWLPAPPHTLPDLPGRPPMVGYLVLVPADQRPPFAPVAVPAPAEPAPEPVVRIDAVRRIAHVDGRELDLTYLEFELLAHLVAHPHRVHTRDQLVTTVWGYGHVGDGRTVDVHIARLRRKLGAQYRHAIQTVRRVGYKYTPPTAG
ncbi:winged helix-turn-helix domain-containing protein [Streptomyces bauhiniae]|uniref:Winged helix-turn-helix transcriptional regulator n=1 Tax=Streptomyces bauhiniae TaxID=2340725 RepID=A0A7K3QPF4_9ACTN|nr:winged helix-turn-helix domain-containing protein [Streptomyces bauhiniae]NEB91722.1 winged helix-turn-helix transcriptional regulator [Streptomyces bauhiniae]